jgi:CheY-like chemotaxis protein
MTTVLAPYCHPTTVCFVDDNYSFLRSIGMDLPDDWSYMSFLQPEDALAIINEPEPMPPLAERCFSMDNSDPSAPLIRMDLPALEQEIKLVDRFRRVSVLLVDYAMPTMNGLEFCEQVVNKDIKKALLTGVADEKTAVEAFNRGLIDRYIPKAGLARMNAVIPHVDALKAAYFEQYSNRLYSNLALNPPAFMTEQSIKPLFDRILHKHHIVEYYLAAEPYGYLMLRADGSMLRLIVLSQAEHEAHIEMAASLGAPQTLLKQMRAGAALSYFMEHPSDYPDDEDFPWQEMIVPATTVQGAQTWYIGVLPDPPADIDFDPAVSSYTSFLKLMKPQV